jgi:hypothetical protein
MKLADFLLYIHWSDCSEIDRRRRYILWVGPTGGLAQIPRYSEHLERETVYLLCMDLGIDMPEKFEKYQGQMDKIWPGRKFKP